MLEVYLDEFIDRIMNVGRCLGLFEVVRFFWGIISVLVGVIGELVFEDVVSGWWLGKDGSRMLGIRNFREEGG